MIGFLGIIIITLVVAPLMSITAYYLINDDSDMLKAIISGVVLFAIATVGLFLFSYFRNVNYGAAYKLGNATKLKRHLSLPELGINRIPQNFQYIKNVRVVKRSITI